MLVKYMCSKCKKTYDYYDGVYRKFDFDREKDRDSKTAYKDGNYINANCIMVYHHQPSAQADETQDYEDVQGSLAKMLINLCPECMHELLTTLQPLYENMNCFDI